MDQTNTSATSWDDNNNNNSSSADFPPLGGIVGIKRNPNRIQQRGSDVNTQQQQYPQQYPPQQQQQQPALSTNLPSEHEIDQHTPTYNLQNYHPYFESQSQIKILTRKKENVQNDTVTQKQTKTLEEKKKDYEKIRAMLFSDGNSNDDDKDVSSPSSSSSNNYNNTTPPTNTSPVNNRYNNNQKVYSPGSFKQSRERYSPAAGSATSGDSSPGGGVGGGGGGGVRQPLGPDGSRGFSNRGRGGRRGGAPQ